jgi:heme/copper-type cytochrome/quinol oxidase subunit 2
MRLARAPKVAAAEVDVVVVAAVVVVVAAVVVAAAAVVVVAAAVVSSHRHTTDIIRSYKISHNKSLKADLKKPTAFSGGSAFPLCL